MPRKTGTAPVGMGCTLEPLEARKAVLEAEKNGLIKARMKLEFAGDVNVLGFYPENPGIDGDGRINFSDRRGEVEVEWRLHSFGWDAYLPDNDVSFYETRVPYWPTDEDRAAALDQAEALWEPDDGPGR